MNESRVARWETRGGRYWLELYWDSMGFTYREDNGGGNLGNLTLPQAFERMYEIIRNRRLDGINLNASITF